MVEPVGATLGVLGLVGTAVQLLQSGYVAADRKLEVLYLRGQLEMEAFLLRRWAEGALIIRGPDGVDKPKVIPKEQCRLVDEQMEYILALFDTSSKLIERQDPRFVSETLVQPAQTGGPEAWPQTRLSRVLRSGAVSSSRVFKWVVRDADRLSAMLVRIESMRRKLQELLPANTDLVKLQLLVDAVSEAPDDHLSVIRQATKLFRERNPADAPAMNLVCAASMLREQHPSTLEGVRVNRAEMETHKIKDAEFVPEAPPIVLTPWHTWFSSKERGVSDRDVIIEWRLFKGMNNDELFDFEQSVAELVQTIALARDHPDSHLPRCFGYIVDTSVHAQIKFGLVLDLGHRDPQDLPASLVDIGAGPPITLHDAISNTGTAIPALEQRMKLSSNVTITIFQILSARWFHKGIRSSSVLLPNGLDLDFGLDNPQPAIEFVLAGFEFARPNRLGQMSINSTDTGNLDIYRHPDATSDKWSTDAYKAHGYLPAFDIYGLGTLLAEIGFWTNMTELHADAIDEGLGWQRFPGYLRRRVANEMPGMMGTRYTRAVAWCLDARGQVAPGQDNLFRAFEEEVMSVLATLVHDENEGN